MACFLMGMVLSAWTAHAQPGDDPGMLGVIPFDYIDHVFLDVTLNDSLEAVLVYDPVRGILLDERFARRHGLPTFGGEEVGYGAPVTVGGAGGVEHVVTFARALTVRDGNLWQPGGMLERTFPLTPVIPLDSMMAVALGRRVDGLFGIDLLAEHVLEFDFERERLVLHDPGAFVPPPEATGIPITWMGRARKPSVLVEVHLPAGERVEGRFLLDFGMGGAFRLTTGFTESYRLHERITPTVSSDAQTGLGGALQSLYGRVPAVSIGTVRVERPVLSMARETEGADAYPEHDGLIGLGLLDRYRVFYDAPGERLWLAPTPRTEQPYVYVEAGLQWEPVGRGGTGLVVREVTDDSPAAEAGLLPGDRLLAVDGTDATGWTRREWQAAVDRAAARASGTESPGVFRLRVLHDGTPRTVRLRVLRHL